MDTRQVARHFAATIVEHRNRLAGKAEDASRAQQAFASVHTELAEHRVKHRDDTHALLADWVGRDADGFSRRADRTRSALRGTGEAAGKAAGITAGAAEALVSGHGAVVRLLDEYTERAVRVLDAGLAVGQRPALMRAVGEVADLVRQYTGESAKQVAETKVALADAAHRLRALHEPREKPKRAGSGSAGGSGGSGGSRGSEDTRGSGGSGGAGGAHRVTQVAASQLGYHEGPGNTNKYGPAAPWCSSFATWVWRRAGVNIPLLPFTGAVFTWGKEKGLAYRDLSRARPGDVLLFGTGPQNTSTSTHIGIVEKVNGDKVTLIEGNAGDSVARRTHTLSHSTFYGGVHPS
ncbi:CHAP domain-containing protein [Actinokineospora terrae]|uniref:CHAP domain-containing protein n=1 Tax=Actinokineospora terrae TaxID=155974 RepID=A0A1H9NPQ0_9PSEU|nr:CHAP domain-containing protein [Actinokineospora terrae]SER37609.1 CHAP domain-containing protein [Actinokineospora terrae]